MKKFKQSKILKGIVFFLVLIFASQQIAWAERIDLLREGNIETSDVLLAMLAGFMQAMAVNPSWTTTQIFAYTYLVPKATEMVVDTLDIKDPILRAGLEMGISMGATTYFDSTITAKAAEDAAKKPMSWASKGKNWLGKVFGGLFGQGKAAVTEAGAKASQKAAEEAAKQATQQAISEVTAVSTNIAVKLVSPLQAALFKAAQGAVYGAAREFLYLNLKKHNKDWAIFLSYTGATLIGQYTGILLSKSTGTVFGIAVETDPATGRERGTGVRAVQLENKEALAEVLSKGTVGTIEGVEGTRIDIQGMQQFWGNFKVATVGGLIETFAATQGYKEVGVVLSAGVTRLLANRLAEQGMSDTQALSEGIKFGAISALL